MGEVIKKVGTIRFAEEVFDVELNSPFTEGGEQLIHIQNKKVRFECNRSDFVKMATLVLRAKENFLYYKTGGAMVEQDF